MRRLRYIERYTLDKMLSLAALSWIQGPAYVLHP